MATERPVDYVVVGLGNSEPMYASSRHNAGHIFVDYLANCIAMQTALLEKSEPDSSSSSSSTNKTSTTAIPANYTSPRFIRKLDLSADIHDVVFKLAPGDVVASKTAGTKPSSDHQIFRLLLVKPQIEMNGSGFAVAKVLAKYDIKNIPRQLIVVFDDLNTLQGSIGVQSMYLLTKLPNLLDIQKAFAIDGGDLRSIQGHKGVEHIVEHLKTGDFIRFRLGIGRPPTGTSVVDFVLGGFTKEKKEMDYFGHALDLGAQALQYLAATGDIKGTKQKFANSKKLPKKLREARYIDCGNITLRD
ncbi:peptidyl-tRNA hydrolase [Phlyctochytrium arcticum]|nr:peptidyl-tRNA hydrolase [Phlyctochytrium arcticum]